MDPYAYARSPFWKETLRCARLKRPQNLAMHLSFLPMPFSSWLSSPCIVCRPLSFLYRCDARTRPDPTAHLIMCVGDRAEIWTCPWMVCFFILGAPCSNAICKLGSMRPIYMCIWTTVGWLICTPCHLHACIDIDQGCCKLGNWQPVLGSRLP